ncbi:hypothetical protein ACFLS1_11675 [Verrucomicrobiota bacterium]
MLSAEKGLRLKEKKADGLREVHTGSVETRMANAQLAYRFKETDWSLSVLLERTKPTIHSEVFHLVSIGEGVLYCSAVATYHIEGAPVRDFKIRIPKEFRNIEFTGRDIRGWRHDGELWTVSLQEKVMGDYTLGLTYDKHFQYKGDDISVGGVQTEETTSEAGYIVLASSASLNLTLKKHDEESIIGILPDEVPNAYTLLLNDPILKAYKYVKAPHSALINVKRFDTEQMIDQVADNTTLTTKISKDGETVTTVVYWIKNLSKQYFVVSLPETADLWFTRIIDENGRRHDVSSMSEKGKTLIPIHRLTDPDKPVRVELVYAESRKKFGARGRTLKFEAPTAAETHSTFAKWTFNIPEKYAIARIGGNITAENLARPQNIINLVAGFFGLCMITLKTFSGWFVFGIVCVICMSIITYSWSSHRGFIWKTIICVIIMAGLFAFVVQKRISHAGLRRLSNMSQLNKVVTVEATKTMNLASADPLTARLDIVPAWIGSGGSLGLAVLAGVIGLFLISRSRKRKETDLTTCALGLTVIIIGLAKLAVGHLILMSVLIAGLPLLLAIGLIRWSYRRGLRRMETMDMNTFCKEIPEPFEPEIEEDIPQDENTEIEKNGESEKQDTLHEIRDTNNDGNVRIGLLVLLVSLGLCFTAGARTARQIKPVVPGLPVLQSVDITANAPKMHEDSEKSMQVNAAFEFELSNAGTFVLLRSPAVLTEYKLNSRHLSVKTSQEGYLLTAQKDGKYKINLKYSVPIQEREGTWSTVLAIPGNLHNKVMLNVPEKELDIESPDAVLLKKTEKDGVSTAQAVYGSATAARISWHGRVRKTKLEKEVFFSEVNSLALFEPGVVDITSLIRYQIAQGEMKSMTLVVPENMTVTAVHAPGLSTWRFDPETRLLEAVLEKPVSGDFTFKVVSQVGCEGLPYDTVIGAFEVKNTARQRGSIAMAVPNTVQIRVDKTEGLNPMNIEDVSKSAITSARRGIRGGLPTTIKRAFRYHSLPVSAKIHAERVLPEIRVVENASLSVADERIVLSSKLKVTVSKAGIFSLKIGLAKGFDVETLTGTDISHWDETEDDTATRRSGEAAKHEVTVHFRKQAIGMREINLVIARTEKGIEDTIEVPRVSIANALKHTGVLVVSGERGVRMTTVEREGVSELNPRDLSIREAGVLAFKLLRPEWLVRLKAEVVAPTIRSDVLQRVDVSEGMLQCTAYIRYRIDHAGCKTFRIQSPFPGVPLTVTGRNISKVNEIDSSKGIWEAELHSKVENNYALEIRYKISSETHSERIKILPLRTIDVESQKGYLVIMSGGRVQVRPMGSLAGLKLEEARSIPAHFGAGDLSDAIFCYRTVSGEYGLDLSVIRHNVAKVLPANIKEVLMTSVVSDGGQVLTHVVLNMTAGDLQFLKMELPDRDAKLWTALVKGKAASISRDGDTYLIPLEEPVPGESTIVELVYAGSARSGWLSNKQKYVGPKFGLPLQNIKWEFYVVQGRRYYGFGGTMEHDKTWQARERFDAKRYVINNLRQIEHSREIAKSNIEESQVLAKKGYQKRARKALESAINYSQGDMAFNEDARIQFKNLAEQQAVVGLVQRRDEMRFARNIQQAGQQERMEEFKDGRFTTDYARKVQQSLSDQENKSLMLVAEKILSQQSAAERMSQAINITMPTHGRKLQFKRSLQIDPEADMVVSFKAGSGRLTGNLLTLLYGAILLVLLRLSMGRIRT